MSPSESFGSSRIRLIQANRLASRTLHLLLALIGISTRDQPTPSMQSAPSATADARSANTSLGA